VNEQDIELFSSSKSDHWQTPEWLYKYCFNVLGCDFDPCPIHADHDALATSWEQLGDHAYVNPPYSADNIKAFMTKSYLEIIEGRIDKATFLTYSKTETKFWHECVLPNASVIRFINTGLTFTKPGDDDQHNTMHPSSLITFNRETCTTSTVEIDIERLRKQVAIDKVQNHDLTEELNE